MTPIYRLEKSQHFGVGRTTRKSEFRRLGIGLCSRSGRTDFEQAGGRQEPAGQAALAARAAPGDRPDRLGQVDLQNQQVPHPLWVQDRP